MSLRFWSSLAALTVISGTLGAQTFQRNASMRGDYDGRGKCTIEVVVDGAAEVEIRGASAVLRNLYGQPAQWRRFECNAPLPRNPSDFRFAGVDGRGRQELVRDPRNGGVAVVRIEDKQGGSEGYTFDIFWTGGFDGGGRPGGPPPQSRRWTVEQAVRGCQETVRQQAADRFRTSVIDFRKTAIDDNPGRRDWVVGSFAIRRYNRDEEYRFSCSVDFDSGRVRSAQIDERR
jgi:hypothetical protein